MARILIIEDDDQNRALLKEALERAGHQVVTAREGAQGIHRISQTPVDLVITDILMPGKEGLETIQILRQENPRQKILAYSGGGSHGLVHVLDIAKKLGADSTLAKPFDLTTFLSLVEDTLQRPPPH